MGSQTLVELPKARAEVRRPLTLVPAVWGDRFGLRSLEVCPPTVLVPGTPRMWHRRRGPVLSCPRAGANFAEGRSVVERPVVGEAISNREPSQLSTTFSLSVAHEKARRSTGARDRAQSESGRSGRRCCQGKDNGEITAGRLRHLVQNHAASPGPRPVALDA